MKRASPWILAIVLCASLAACAGSPSRGTEVENPDLDAAVPGGYTNAAFAISIDYPAGWTYQEQEGMVIFQGPQTSFARLTFEESDVTPDTLDDYLITARPGVALDEYEIERLAGALITEPQWDPTNQMWKKELFIPLNDVRQLGRLEFLYRFDDVSQQLSIRSEKDRLNFWALKAATEYQEEEISRMIETLQNTANYHYGANLNKDLFLDLSQDSHDRAGESRDRGR